MVEDAPALDAGVTHLDTPGPRSTALHRLVVDELVKRDGPVYWIDARNVAASYVLYKLAPHPRTLDEVCIARAFTAYQHHTLAHRLVRIVNDRTAMIVTPNVGSLYQDDDVPNYERDELYAATTMLLAEIGETYGIPVLLTSDTSNVGLPPAVANSATQLSCERTRMGLRYVGPDFETQVYVEEGFWQTTIPYWTELFGIASKISPSAATSKSASTPALDAWCR